MHEVFHRGALLVLLSGLSGSCATMPDRSVPPAAPAAAPVAATGPAETPPDYIAVGIDATNGGRGFVYRQSYFSEAEVLDPRWEVRRRETMNRIRMCPTYRITRRDIRWYEPTPESGQRCAAIIYTAWCAGPGHGNPARTEADRIAALRQDVDAHPIGRRCGDKDPAHIPDTPSATAAAWHAEEEAKWTALLSTSAACDGADTETADPVRVLPETRFHVRTLASPAFRAVVPPRFRADWLSRVPLQMTNALYEAGRVVPQVRTTPIEDNGVNILVTQQLSLKPDGTPYCVQLTARQGPRLWRHSIHRAGFVEQLAQSVGIDRQGRSRDPSRYWSPASDGVDLASALGAYLLRRASPDREFRRGCASAGGKPANTSLR
jgi:hypothetical protein